MLADWIQYEDWSILDSCSNSSEMVECFSNLTLKKLDEICPLKSVRITKFDQEITSTCINIKELSREKNREYLKNRNSSKYKRLKKELKSKIKSEGAKLIQKQIDLLGEKGNKWFRFAKKITTRPGGDTLTPLPYLTMLRLTSLQTNLQQRFAGFSALLAKNSSL